MLKTHAGFFRLSMKGKVDFHLLWPFHIYFHIINTLCYYRLYNNVSMAYHNLTVNEHLQHTLLSFYLYLLVPGICHRQQWQFSSEFWEKLSLDGISDPIFFSKNVKLSLGISFKLQTTVHTNTMSQSSSGTVLIY